MLLTDDTFGRIFSDHQLEIRWTLEGGWQAPELCPQRDIPTHPASLGINHGVACFEGMKAYKDASGATRLFRPDRNMARLNSSLERLHMPQVDGDSFTECIKELLRVLKVHWHLLRSAQQGRAAGGGGRHYHGSDPPHPRARPTLRSSTNLVDRSQGSSVNQRVGRSESEARADHLGGRTRVGAPRGSVISPLPILFFPYPPLPLPLPLREHRHHLLQPRRAQEMRSVLPFPAGD